MSFDNSCTFFWQRSSDCGQMPEVAEYSFSPYFLFYFPQNLPDFYTKLFCPLKYLLKTYVTVN